MIHLGDGSSTTEANELAMSVALSHFAKKNGKQADNCFVLGFDKGHHGDSEACLRVSSEDSS